MHRTPGRRIVTKKARPKPRLLILESRLFLFVLVDRGVVVFLVSENFLRGVIFTSVARIAGCLSHIDQSVGDSFFMILHDAHLFVVSAGTVAGFALNARKFCFGIGRVALEAIVAIGLVGRGLGMIERLGVGTLGPRCILNLVAHFALGSANIGVVFSLGKRTGDEYDCEHQHQHRKSFHYFTPFSVPAQLLGASL